MPKSLKVLTGLGIRAYSQPLQRRLDKNYYRAYREVLMRLPNKNNGIADILGAAEVPLDVPDEPIKLPHPLRVIHGAPAYSLVLDDEVQEAAWYQFLKGLQEAYPNVRTVGARLYHYLKDTSPLPG